VTDGGACVPGAVVLREASALVYVDDLELLAIDSDDRHHLVSVLRLSPGETVIASDGRGRWRTCALRATERSAPGSRRPAKAADQPQSGVLEATSDVMSESAPSRLLTVGFAMTKGDRSEWTVQKLTELGVDRIWPIISSRTIVRLGAADAPRRAERFRRVAREAAAQSRRAWLPEVHVPAAFSEAVRDLAAAPGGVRLAEPGGGPMSPDTSCVVVGPEGGWTPDELAESGLDPVALGPTILRAETAAIVAGALLCAIRTGTLQVP